MTNDQPFSDIDVRAEEIAQGSNLTWVSALLAAERDRVLDRWLMAAKMQPFHAHFPASAVSDHIPALYDAIVGFLARGGPSRAATGAVMDDPAILGAAERHAQARLVQGLQPVDVTTEFRLLRQEIVKALLDNLPESVPTSDVLGAELLVHDALDGAVSVALHALATLVERVREDFLVTTVHDVRGPLTLMRASAQLADRRLTASPPDVGGAQAELARIVASADRMEALLAELVEASRVALNRLELRREPVDLQALVEDTVDRFGPELGQRVRVEVEPGSMLTGEWDGPRLERVLSNLLSNAAKYAPGETPITVSLSGTPTTVSLLVRDEGIGVAAEELPRVFHRYARASGAVATGTPGLGLGLYICRGIVEAHDGRIWMTSAGPGTGATVHVVLPRVPYPGHEAPN